MYQLRKGLQTLPLELGGERYSLWKEDLLLIERHLLKELGFCLYNIVMDPPHKYILYYIKILHGDKALSQLSWNYLNDSYRLDLCLKYPAREIACSAIYLSARILSFPLPISPFPWWRLMASDFQRVECIAEEILTLYTCNKVK